MKNKKTLFIISFALVFVIAVVCMIVLSLNGVNVKVDLTADTQTKVSDEIQLEDDDFEIMIEDDAQKDSQNNSTDSTTKQKNDKSDSNKETVNSPEDKTNSVSDKSKDDNKTDVENSDDSGDVLDKNTGDNNDADSQNIELPFVPAQ